MKKRDNPITDTNDEILVKVRRVFGGDIDSDLQSELNDPDSELSSIVRSVIVINRLDKPIDWGGPSPQRPMAARPWFWVSAIAASTFVLAALGIWMAMHWSAPEKFVVLDNGVRRTIQNGQLVDPTDIPKDAIEQTERAIQNKLDLSDLVSRVHVLRGSNQEDQFSLKHPVGVVVRSTQPSFEWRKAKNATMYRVTIVSNSGKMFESPFISDLTWTSNSNNTELTRGEVYEWQVEAFQGEKRIGKAPSPEIGPAKFKVVRLEHLQRIVQLESIQPPSFLALGAAYAEAGFIDEAIAELQKVSNDNPDWAEIKETIKSLEALLATKSQINNE